jgi:type II secretory pathway component PulF
MNHEELAFVNQQLAGMLKCGIPLEGGLKQLCSTMRRGKLRAELEALEADLAKGTPLKDALATRQLPDFYKHMLVVGAQANDLPGVLTMLADHYLRTHSLRTRIKGMMVYPLLVLLTALALSLALTVVFRPLVDRVIMDLADGLGMANPSPAWWLWFVPGVLLLACLLVAIAIGVPRIRDYLRWHLPGLKDANVANVSASLSVLVANGVPLPDALALLARQETSRHANADLSLWKSEIESGQWKSQGSFERFRVLPPLFFWCVAAAGEQIASGFKQAADLYARRAAHQSDMILFAALPISIIVVGSIVLNQFWPVFYNLIRVMDALGGTG